MLKSIVDKHISPREGVLDEVVYNFETNDTMQLIFEVLDHYYLHTEIVAKHIPKTYAGLRQIWNLVHNHIRYVKDAPKYEDVKSPAATWDDGFGDCKSMSIFIASILRNMGIKFSIRFVGYDPNVKVSHVYAVAHLNGRDVILDAVYDKFDAELPFESAFDYTLKSGKYKRNKIAGIPAKSFSFAQFFAVVGVLFFGYKLIKS